MSKKLHVVSFDIPYPPNYGGIIDVFYKIKELHKLGVEIYLHIHFFNNQQPPIELEKYCKKIFYYPRNPLFISLFSNLPFRIKNRISYQLNSNLKDTKLPILFEGLHTIYPLYKFNLNNCFVRAHNIEHTYFFGLAKSENNIFKKIFYLLEGWKLKKFEKHLKKATGIFTISPFEQGYFSKKYKNAYYIPAFHERVKITNSLENENFILYHGDLRISDNIKAALFLIEVYKNTHYKFVIATSIKEKKVLEKSKVYPNIYIEEIPNKKDLDFLLKKAYINTLITFQKTGIKLKLLNTLYRGKHIIANTKLVQDTGLESVCHIANTKEEILAKTAQLFNKNFSDTEIQKRIVKLKEFSPEASAKKMVSIIFTS